MPIFGHFLVQIEGGCPGILIEGHYMGAIVGRGKSLSPRLPRSQKILVFKMAKINKVQVSLDRDRYLQRMWANGLRPVIYLLDGRIWPTLEACSQDIGYSTTFITHECLLDDGYFAFFPEYFWGRWKTAGASSQFATELKCIEAGVMFDVNPTIVRRPIKFRRLEKDLEEIPGEIPKEPRYYEKRGKLGVMVLDKTTWTLYPSISACARALKTSRSAIYYALARDGVIKGHRLTL